MPITLDKQPEETETKRSRFDLLQKNDSLLGSNLGGKFALPAEFDTTKLAAGLYGEGQEARSMEARQPIVGSPYTADGWTVWKYPDKHPLAGQPHKVAGAKPGENFVLMCRSKEIQDQVNHVYGLVSIDMMTREIKGESLADDAGGRDPGMIPDTRLKREIGVEREIEEAQGRDTSVHSHVTPGAVIERRSQRVSR